jgi:hypothetical protein
VIARTAASAAQVCHSVEWWQPIWNDAAQATLSVLRITRIQKMFDRLHRTPGSSCLKNETKDGEVKE